MPASNYEARVQARNDHGWNKLSSVFHFSTRAEGIEFISFYIMHILFSVAFQYNKLYNLLYVDMKICFCIYLNVTKPLISIEFMFFHSRIYMRILIIKFWWAFSYGYKKHNEKKSLIKGIITNQLEYRN